MSVTDHAEQFAAIRRAIPGCVPFTKPEYERKREADNVALEALAALEAALAAGERERQQLRDALERIALGAESNPAHEIASLARAALAGEGDATPPDGDTTNG